MSAPVYVVYSGIDKVLTTSSAHLALRRLATVVEGDITDGESGEVLVEVYQEADGTPAAVCSHWAPTGLRALFVRAYGMPRCEYCGDEATPDNPVQVVVTSPPAGGWAMQGGWYHRPCGTEISRRLVQ